MAGRNSGGGRGMSNVDKGQTRREDEYSQTRMVEKSTRGGGGRGIPNEEGDDMPNADGTGGTKKKTVRCMTHAGDLPAMTTGTH